MDRVIEGYNRAAAAAAAATATASGRVDSCDAEEDEDRLEQTARTSILALAHAAPKRPPSPGNSASPSSATAGFDLRAVFNSLGGPPAAETAVLRTGDLQAALVRLSREDNRMSSDTTGAVPSAGVSDAAAARVAARVVGTSEGVDYRRFEDWIMPPRGLEEVRRVLIELVDEGSALGLTAAELFLQLNDDAQHEGIASRELKKGLASLSVHLTETEVEMVMAGAGCCPAGGGIDERHQSGTDRLIMTLQEFLALVQNPLDRQRAIPVTATDSAARASEANKSPQGAELSHARRRTNDTNSAAAAEDGDGCVTPDSLAPRMSLSELQVLDDGKGTGGSAYAGGPATSNSTAAHVEAFGRVAADVQAVLATAVSGSGTGHSGPGNGGQDGCASGTSGKRGGRGGSNSKGRSSPVHSPNSPAGPAAMEACAADSSGNRVGVANRTLGEEEGKEKKEEEGRQGGEEQESISQTSAGSRVSTAASRSAPFPRTGAITPPFGPARSPSEPLHPTRASRERLEAALEGLDLKERLRPTTTVGGNDGDNGSDHPITSLGAPRRSSNRSAGARLPAEGAGGEARQASSQRCASSVGGSRRRPETSSSFAKVAVGTPASPAAFSSRRLASDVAGGGIGSSSRRPVAGRRRIAATGVNERGSRVGRLSGTRSGAAGSGQRQQQLLGKVVDLTAAEGAQQPAYDGGSEGAPEVIGGLRAKVAELELAEHLLRCELEGARADLVSEGRRAEEESRREAARAKERERVLQAKMGARLRAAEAEAAATAKRMADFKRASAIEAAAREKSSADYLRRRLKEAEVALEAKAARRISSSKRQQQQQRAYSATGRRHKESWGGDNGTDSAGGSESGDGAAGRGIGSSSSRWAQRRARRRIVPPGDAGGGVGGERGAAAAASKLREELASCRKKLDVATAEVSRLKKEVSAASGKNGGARGGGCEGAEERGGGGGPVVKERRGGKKSTRAGKACPVCGERGRRSRERQRERRLAARMAESEDARIEVEAEAGRLQAFLDEMRGLGPPIVQYWRGGAEREAE